MSVILPFYNVEDYLAESVASIVNQTLRDIEVILVDDGSTDGSAAIAIELANSDPRVAVVTQTNSGPGAARNAGVSRATGQYISFVDSDDRLPRGSLEVLVRSARSNAADVVVGALSRFDSTRKWVPAWAKGVHSDSRQGITLREFPALLRNNYPVGKVYRREFWNQQGLQFRVGVIYEDQPLIAQMLDRASRLNVLTDITYEYRRREDRSSISQRPEEVSDLRDRVAAWDLSLKTLCAESSAEVLAGWYDTVYGTHLHWYLNNDSIADDEYWRILRSSLLRLREREPAEVLAGLSPERRVALLLLDAGRQKDMIAFRNSSGYDLAAHSSTVSPAGVHYSLPVSSEIQSRLPPDIFVASAASLGLRQQLVRGGWLGEGDNAALRISGSAYIPGIDLCFNPTLVEVFATSLAGGRVVHAEMKQSSDPALNLGRSEDAASYDGAGYVAEFPLSELARGAEVSTRWALSIRVTTAHITVTEPLGNVSSRGGLTELGSFMVGEQRRVRLKAGKNRHAAATIVLENPAVIVHEVSLHGRTLTVNFRSSGGRRFIRMHGEAEGGCGQITANLSPAAGNTFEAVVQVPPLSGDVGVGAMVSWTLRLEDDSGSFASLSWAEGRTPVVPLGTGTLRAYGSAAGNLKLEEFPDGCIVVNESSPANSDQIRLTGFAILPTGCQLVEVEGWKQMEAESFDNSTQQSSENPAVPLAFELSADHESGVTITRAHTRNASDEARIVPVVLGRAALSQLPLVSASGAIVVERARGRTLAAGAQSR